MPVMVFWRVNHITKLLPDVGDIGSASGPQVPSFDRGTLTMIASEDCLHGSHGVDLDIAQLR